MLSFKLSSNTTPVTFHSVGVPGRVPRRDRALPAFLLRLHGRGPPRCPRLRPAARGGCRPATPQGHAAEPGSPGVPGQARAGCLRTGAGGGDSLTAEHGRTACTPHFQTGESAPPCKRWLLLHPPPLQNCLRDPTPCNPRHARHTRKSTLICSHILSSTDPAEAGD